MIVFGSERGRYGANPWVLTLMRVRVVVLSYNPRVVNRRAPSGGRSAYYQVTIDVGSSLLGLHFNLARSCDLEAGLYGWAQVCVLQSNY